MSNKKRGENMSANRQPKPNFHADQARMPAPGAQPVPDEYCSECPDEQAALARMAEAVAKLAITRWQHASRGAHLDLNRPHHESARARWYAHVRQGLQDWIERGGFSQPDEICDVPKQGAMPVPTRQARNDRPCGGRRCDNMQCNNACVD